MPDITFQALDLTGLNETAEQVRAIVQEAKAEIEAELDSDSDVSSTEVKEAPTMDEKQTTERESEI